MEHFKSILGWSLLIVPPLPIFSLVVIPFDIFTVLFWLAGGMFMVLSVASILFTVVSRKACTFKCLIRPGLTIVAFSAAVVSSKYSLYLAKEMANDTAQKIKQQCVVAGCPKYIVDWRTEKNSLGASTTLAGALIKYPLRYHPQLDMKSFSIEVRVNFEEEYRYTLVNGEIIESHRSW